MAKQNGQSANTATATKGQQVPEARRHSPLRILAELLLVAAGVMSLCYGAAVLALGTGSTFFLFWFILGAALIIWALALVSGRTARVPLWAKITCGVVGVALAATLGGAYVALSRHADDVPPAGVDYLIVLGSQVTEHGPSAVTRLRLYAAMDYLRENPGTICIVSGGQGPNEPWTEARGMRDFLVDQGIPTERIIMEDQSRDTAENIAFSSALIPEGATIALVSNNFHIFRALQIAKHQGLTNVYGLATPMAPFYFPNNAMREVIAICCYTILGRM